MPRSGSIRLAVAALLALSVSEGARADGMRCPGGLVSTGDTKLDLLGKCGRPALAESAAAWLATATGPPGRVLSEIWTYDFGPSQFVMAVRIVKGRIASIERGSYGYAGEREPLEPPPRATCDPAALAEGKLTHEILARCGPPAVADAWEEETLVAHAADGVGVVTVLRTVELWSYDFGPSRFVRLVTIEDGKVTRVESGGYGYAR